MSATPQPQPPPRVSASLAHGDGSISVRTQIKLAKYFKELSKQDSRNCVKTRFRKAKSETCRDREEDDNSAFHTDAPTYLLVDGYNIVGQWPALKKLRDEGQMARARDTLTTHLLDYAYYMDWRIEVVFDASGNEERSGLGNSVEEAGAGVEVVFSGEAADTYIDLQTRNLLDNDLASSVFVASADWAVQQACEAHNARVISARQLVNQILGLQGAIRKQVASSNLEAAAHFGAFTDHLSANSRGSLLEIERALAQTHRAAKPIKARTISLHQQQQQQQQAARQQQQQLQARQMLAAKHLLEVQARQADVTPSSRSLPHHATGDARRSKPAAHADRRRRAPPPTG
jgi:hypothetical protein